MAFQNYNNICCIRLAAIYLIHNPLLPPHMRSNFYICWFLISNLVKAWLLEEYAPFIAYLICGCNIQTRSARIWKQIMHRPFKAWKQTDACCKSQAYRCSVLCAFVSTTAKRSLHASCQIGMSISGLSSTEGRQGWFVSATRHTRGGDLQDSPPLLPEPEEISPNSLLAGTAIQGEPGSRTVGSHALHTTKPSQGFSLQPKDSQAQQLWPQHKLINCT